MKKNDIFTFTAPNGVEVTGVALTYFESVYHTPEKGCSCIKHIIAYAQNRIVQLNDKRTWMNGHYYGPITQDRILVDYAILPEYDAILENYQH